MMMKLSILACAEELET